jgi:hypothetical protein
MDIYIMKWSIKLNSIERLYLNGHFHHCHIVRLACIKSTECICIRYSRYRLADLVITMLKMPRAMQERVETRVRAEIFAQSVPARDRAAL